MAGKKRQRCDDSEPLPNSVMEVVEPQLQSQLANGELAVAC
jgi:hypothetical protein